MREHHVLPVGSVGRIVNSRKQKLGDRIMDLEKWAFGMWAFIAHGGLSKPMVGFQSPRWASINMGAIFLKKKKRLRQRRGSSRASRKMGAIFLIKIAHDGL